MRISIRSAFLGATALASCGLLQPQTALAQEAAQDAAPEATQSDANTIIVTARRRDESIVDVPLAITVVTNETLDKLNIRSTSELANFVPGLQFSDFTPGNSRNDRGGNRPIIFRGLNLARNGGVTQAASMFLDGSAVIGNEIPGSYDIGAVEVLRGPQNVYFGRSTMTGAIAYRTKAIPDDLTFEANAVVAERGTYRGEVSVSGMIARDVLGARVTGLIEKTGGFVTNLYDPDGQKFGERKRRSISATVNFTPVEALEVKLYANYFEDEDGISATVNVFPDATISTGGAGNPQAGTVIRTGQVTNCVRGIAFGGLPARPTICGKVPGRRFAFPYSNTDIPANHLRDTFAVPYLRGEGFEQQPGLQRNAFNSHAVINLQISDYLRLQSITGYHTNAVIQVLDGIQRPPLPTSASTFITFGLSNKFTDFSQELRLSSDPERAFSWTIGGTYVNAENLSNATNTRTLANGVYSPLQFNIGDDQAKTYGAFAGAYLRLLDDRLTISAEGRYQVDKRSNTLRGFLNFPTVVNTAAKDFKAFTPRVSIDYDVGGGRKVYASYAEGNRPGGFNNALLSFFDSSNAIYRGPNAITVAQGVVAINSVFGVTDPSFDEERLQIIEVGFKGSFAGGRGYFDINAYYGKLKDQQVTFAAVVPFPAPAGPTTLSATGNPGELEIYGVEVTGNFNFTQQLSFSGSFAYNQTNRTRFIDTTPGNIRLYGITDYSGLETPNTPKITASGVLTYEDRDGPNWTPFGTVAVVYRGKQFADIANYSFIPGRATVDLRAGYQNDRFRIEAFVTNLFDNKTYPGGNVATDFGAPPTNTGGDQGFFGAYADPQTFGVRGSVTF
ncbi:TonB-dependent receptor [Blastomonas fulva]|uniref:TonB-dependent receptor n=1 Tax=Blastomonas fulva TaxID=1550728 RepID=UPI003F7117A9